MVLDIEQETGIAKDTSSVAVLLALVLVETRMVPMANVVRKKVETTVLLFMMFLL